MVNVIYCLMRMTPLVFAEFPVCGVWVDIVIVECNRSNTFRSRRKLSFRQFINEIRTAAGWIRLLLSRIMTAKVTMNETPVSLRYYTTKANRCSMLVTIRWEEMSAPPAGTADECHLEEWQQKHPRSFTFHWLNQVHTFTPLRTQPSTIFGRVNLTFMEYTSFHF